MVGLCRIIILVTPTRFLHHYESHSTMNMLTRTLCLFTVALLMAGAFQDADAQIWKRAKERAEKKINERIEQRTDEAVDKTVEKGEEGLEDAVNGAVARMGEAAAEEQMKEYNLGPNATSPASARQVRYRTVTSVDLGGGLGALSRMAGQGLGSTLETVTLTSTHQRTDDEETSTIIDLEGERFILLDHARKEYTEKTFAEMAEEAAEQLDAAKQSLSEQDEDVDVATEFAVTTDRTGRRDVVNGAEAEQILLKIRMDVSGTDQETGQTGEAAMHVIVDTWMTDRLAGSETMQQFQRRMGERFGEHVTGVSGADFAALFAQMGQDPRMGTSLKQAAEEMQKMPGMAVRSATYLVLAPAGAEIDVERAMAAPEKGESGLAGLMQMAESMEGSGEVTEQITLVTVTNQIADLQPSKDASFDVPKDYKRVDSMR